MKILHLLRDGIALALAFHHTVALFSLMGCCFMGSAHSKDPTVGDNSRESK